jgi:hypothetical protein
MRWWIIVQLMLVSAFNVTAYGESNAPSIQRKELSVEQSQELLIKALEPSGVTALPKFSVVYWKESSTPRFVFFSGSWDSRAGGSVVTGNYYVDKLTGDVWEASICRELKSSGLERLKHELRRSIELSDVEYTKLRIAGPMC